MLKKHRDKKQLQALLSGEEAELKKFFDEYFPRLYRFANERLCGEHDATREVVQNTLSKVLINIHKFRGESALFTWLCSICSNEIFDHKKRQSRYNQVISLHGDTADLNSLPNVEAGSTPEQPDVVYDHNEKSKLIHRILDLLPDNYGNVIEWKYVEGLSVAQIAEKLDLGHSAAQSLLFRARIAFQSSYNDLTKTELK